MKRGYFITFEGGEGAGKSTQLSLLSQELSARGVQAVATREPGGSPGGEEIRRLLVEGAVSRWDAMTEALLHYAARREHLVRTIWPALDTGAWVVSDRFSDSTMAYQGGGHGVSREALQELHRLVVGDFAPDLTLILDMPVEEGLRRADSRGGKENRYERMGADFHERLRREFLAIAAAEPDRCRVISALGAPDQVHQAVMAEIDALSARRPA